MRKSIFRILLSLYVGSVFMYSPCLAEEIHDAARQGDLAKVKEMLAHTPGLLHLKTESGKTPLHFAAEGGHLDVVDFLLSKGAEVDARNADDETPLHYAAGYSHMDVIKRLLEAESNVNAESKAGDTPLLYVRFMLRKEVAEILIDSGADVNARNDAGESLLQAAFSRGRADLVDFLLERGAGIDTEGPEGARLLISAVNMGSDEHIAFLLSKNVLDTGDKADIARLLHVALSHGYGDLVTAVLKRDPDTTALSSSGGTLLHSAARGDQVEFGRFLLKLDIDINALNRHGLTALQVGEDWGNMDFVDLLKSAGAEKLPRPVIDLKESLADETAETGRVAISYIANEGFLIASSSHHILVDAIFQNPFGYTDTPPSIFERMKRAQAPFQKVDLILFSHNHRDHYTPEMAWAVLKGHPETALAGNSVTIGELKEAAGQDYARISDQVKEFNPEWGEILSTRIKGVALKIFPVNHAPLPREVVTLAYLFDLEGVKILHLGDIAPSANVENFKTYGLEFEDIDIAFVDPFFLQDESGQAILKQHIRPKKIILMHMRPGEVQRYAQSLGEAYPNILVFHDPMQKMAFKK